MALRFNTPLSGTLATFPRSCHPEQDTMIKLSSILSRGHCSHQVAILLVPLLLIATSPFSLCLTQDGLYLLKAKQGLDDPSSNITDWNPRDSTPCRWTGVTCSGGPGGASVVTSLDLSDFNLWGPFPAALCRLPNLTYLSLANNYINSTLEAASLLPCPSLEHLDLSQNLLVGELPTSLAALPALRHLDLSGNNFSGPIPEAFGLFPRLENLTLISNLINGTIPESISNVTSLRMLSLTANLFDSGPLPAGLGNLINLETLWLRGCNLVGPIPPSIGNLKKLSLLDLSDNALEGTIPDGIVGLTNIYQIELYNNSLSGGIPKGMSNLTKLYNLDLSGNLLNGTIPPDMFEMPELENLHLYQNQLVGPLPETVAKAKKLVDLRLFQNQLIGSIPADLGKNSPLEGIELSQNLFTGPIPPGICDMGSLNELVLIDNQLSGSLPEGLGRCKTLRRLRVTNNSLSGVVPAGLWGLPYIYFIDIAHNSFSGPISPLISGGTNISELILSDNQLNGSIPKEIGSLVNLHEFSAENNRFSGPLPASLGTLEQLNHLDLHNNDISGNLITDVKSWIRLSVLNLANNRLTGSIPAEIGNLPVLNDLDLSNNLLQGSIPADLPNLKLNRLNLSNNQLSGDIPSYYNNEAYKNSFLGNPGLCESLSGLCASDSGGGNYHSGASLSVVVSTITLTVAILVIGVALFLWRWRRYQKNKKNKSMWTLTSFHKLGFSEDEILDCLNEDFVIGAGASGKVYKAELSSGESVAVKKLWGPVSKVEAKEESSKAHQLEESFDAEVKTLGNIRHRNIVRLWCCCTHKDCKLLVYEYMPNGSLGDLLHGAKKGLLDWPTRYKIALGAAEGLAYLHHDCSPPIIHRDIKSNNILLDSDFSARVSDFGVAKTLRADAGATEPMTKIAGSYGYIAPEYGYTMKVSEKSDIYSFGVVLLELVTGKPAVDPDQFGEKDLVKWVCSTLGLKGIDHVIDQSLDVTNFREDISKVLDIGLQCTSNLPINRPNMRKVVKMLLEADHQQAEKKEVLTLSPYYFEGPSDKGPVSNQS